MLSESNILFTYLLTYGGIFVSLDALPSSGILAEEW